MRFDFMGYNNTPYIVGEEDLKSEEIVLEKEVEDGTYFVRKTNIDGIFTYGFRQNKEDYIGNPAGYVWSSRAGVMNKAFDVALVEVCYKKEGSPSYTSCSMDLAHLEQLLEGTEYMIDWTSHEDATDVVYKIVKRG